MKPFISRITLDMRDIVSRLCIRMKKGDTNRRLVVTLLDNYLPYQIPDRCTAKFWAKKPDGTIISEDCTIENNTVVYDLPSNISSLEGRVYCELALHYEDSQNAGSPRFCIDIASSIFDVS